MRVARVIVAAVFGWGLHAVPARAIDFAADDASDPVYTNGWQAGDDGGYGWAGSWDFLQVGDPLDSGFGIDSSTLNGIGDPDGDGDIDTGGVAFKLYARNGAQVGTERRLDAPMKTGQTFSIDLDVEALPSNVFAIIDFATDSPLIPRIPRMSFGLRDGSTNYHYYDDDGDVDSGVPVDEGGLHVEFTVTSATTYTMRLTPRIGAPAQRSGTLHGTGAITAFGVYLTADVSPTTRFALFNSPHLVPEPGAAGAEAIALAGLGLLYRRRRRARSSASVTTSSAPIPQPDDSRVPDA